MIIIILIITIIIIIIIVITHIIVLNIAEAALDEWSREPRRLEPGTWKPGNGQKHREFGIYIYIYIYNIT